MASAQISIGSRKAAGAPVLSASSRSVMAATPVAARPLRSRLQVAAAASEPHPSRPHPPRVTATRTSAALCEEAPSSVRSPEAPTSWPSEKIDLSALEDAIVAPPSFGFSTIPAAIAAVARGEAVVVLDDEDRENEGDLILAAEHATPESLAHMVRYTSGVICIGMRGEDLDRLEIPLMVESKKNKDAMLTAFTVTVDLKDGTTTGISAADRAATLRALADPSSVPDTFNKPGHIFPLRAREGGVVTRPGHTEAAVDLSRLAGCHPAGVLSELVNDDGTMQRTPDLLKFGAEHDLHVITIKSLVEYIQEHESGANGSFAR